VGRELVDFLRPEDMKFVEKIRRLIQGNAIAVRSQARGGFRMAQGDDHKRRRQEEEPREAVVPEFNGYKRIRGTQPQSQPSSRGSRIEVKDLKERVGNQWLSLLQDLAPELEEACRELPEHVPCPMHGGSDGFRFFDDGDETGGAVCNTCGSFPDGITLLMKLNDWTFPDTCKKIEEWLDGVDNLWPDEEGSSPVRVPTRASPATAKTNQSVIDYIKNVQAQGEPCAEEVSAYFRSRGLKGYTFGDLGYRAEEYYSDKKIGRLTLPAMIAIFETADGEEVGVIRTYLDPNGKGKARVSEPKKCMAIRKGATMGAAVRLYTPGDVLGIAEGIETAEAVYQATGTPMWATCSANRLEKVVVPTSVKEVQVWADDDSGGVGQKAADALAKRLVKEGFRVKVLLPPKKDKDWLDVLVEKGEKALHSALASAPYLDGSAPVPMVREVNLPIVLVNAPTAFSGKVMRSGDPVPELNKIHFVVSIKGSTYIATESINPDTNYISMDLGGVHDFALRYANWTIPVGKKEVSAANYWLGHEDRRQYQGVVFSPGREVLGYYNLWRGFSVKPIPGDCSLYWKHVRKVICCGDETHYQYVRKWLAHLVQRPDELPGVALVVRGSQGTGKTFFVDIIGRLLGPHYLMLSRMDQVTGKFTGHLKDALLVYANEAIWGGDKQGEGALKSMITDDQCTVEAKGKDSYQVRNYKRLIVSSNEQWAVPMGMDDRRFLVLEASEVQKENKAYFAALSRQMKAGGLEALLYDLQHEDLSGFDVRTKPHSGHGFDMKMRSAQPMDRWWYERLHEGTLACPEDCLAEPGRWDQTPNKDKLHKHFLAYCKEHGFRAIEKVPFGKNLRKLLAGYEIGETKKNNGNCHILPTLQQCREEFQAYSKSGPEIWE
jgi:phage/plasmid primase-like uncharacterized protein